MSPDSAKKILWVALAAVGVVCLIVLYRVVGVGFQILSFIRNERLPKPRSTHPDLGVLILDDQIWEGRMERGGRKFAVYISGGPAGPAPHLVATVLRVINDMDCFNEIAVEFLLAGAPQDQLGTQSKWRLDRKAFKLESVNCVWEQKPDDFWLEFQLEGDPDGIWRVEFQNGQPASTGRDD